MLNRDALNLDNMYYYISFNDDEPIKCFNSDLKNKFFSHNI